MGLTSSQSVLPLLGCQRACCHSCVTFPQITSGCTGVVLYQSRPGCVILLGLLLQPARQYMPSSCVPVS